MPAPNGCCWRWRWCGHQLWRGKLALEHHPVFGVLAVRLSWPGCVCCRRLRAIRWQAWRAGLPMGGILLAILLCTKPGRCNTPAPATRRFDQPVPGATPCRRMAAWPPPGRAHLGAGGPVLAGRAAHWRQRYVFFRRRRADAAGRRVARLGVLAETTPADANPPPPRR